MDTRANYHQSVEGLQKELLYMGTLVEQQINLAVESLAEGDETKARTTIGQDDEVDNMMIKVEEHCLSLIALQQPMASDLRIISMAQKIAVDLERIGDHAVDIAKITIRLAGQPLYKPLVRIPQMADIARDMLQESLRAYTERNVNRAAALAERDDEVDKLYSAIMQELIPQMGTDVTASRQMMYLVMVAQYLERVADHTTNIGEGVIYMVTGKRKDLNI
ncbi:phosphate signaling complex protein PhoU [Paenibacillus cymbidii]|uniref:phosphate signaling complex protein PhoU n=1 Tax=Paenibacillus cymbidii TaxID=1639034 RepID=UPI00108126C5|nr:phosphate signaling complex protein PhoU [Paenibacillus cymbidii]